MIKHTLTMIAATVATMAAMAAEPLTIKQITDGELSSKAPGMMRPISGTAEFASISDDGQKIVAYSFRTGKPTRTIFDAKEAKADAIGAIDGYQVSPDGRRLLLQTQTKPIYRRSFTAVFYVYDTKTRQLSLLTADSTAQVPTFSPDGKRVAYVRDNNIYVTDFSQTRQLTTDGERNRVINGLPDWVNEEEFSFNNAMAWSPDSRQLSWLHYDESAVPTYELQMYRGMKPSRDEYRTYPGLYSYKYPKAGERNSTVSALSYDIASGRTTKYQLPVDEDGYVPRIRTFAGGIALFTMNRHQDLLRIYRADPVSGQCHLLIEEKGDRYIKEEAMEGIQLTDRYILLPSDRDGFMHLYLYDLSGQLLGQLDKGDYDATAVYGIDAAGNVYYQAARPTPMSRTVWTANLKTGSRCLTDSGGWNTATFSGDYSYFLRSWSDRNTPYVYTVSDRRGRTVRTLEDNHELREKWSSLGLPEKELFQLTTSEGVTLNGWMMKPKDFDPSRRYPVVMHQYSGPGSQEVKDSWAIGSMGQGGAFDAYLTQQGFIVVCVDPRGTTARGSQFEKQTYLRLGEMESKDQVEAALWLGRQSYVDSTRIGIWGWSYGGFCTLMSMSEGRGVFRCGVAIAPPTDWRYYDTVYTERYMRTPQENPDGYDTNPIQRAPKLSGALLLCHGTADDNVHPQNTYEYAEALVQADKDFHENYYTNRNHSIRGGNSRNHLLRQVAEWFVGQMR